jgi:hypothetical protein
LRCRKRPALPRTAFHGVCRPSTFEEAGSDQHRACLTRLCSASRLSQPLDALLHPQPFSPCFMRVTPLGFCFQRVSLSGSEENLTAPMPSMPFLAASPKPASCSRLHTAAAPRIERTRSVRTDEHGVTRRTPTDPLLALPLSEVFTPLASAPCFHGTSSHGLSRLAGRTSRPSRRWLCRVSKNQRIGLPLSRTADLPEVCAIHHEIPKETVASDPSSCAP